MPTDYGNKLGSLSSLQTGLSVPIAGGTAVTTVHDFGANTSPQALLAAIRLSFTNVASNDDGEYEVRAQWSDDNSTWPDSGGDWLFGWHGDSAGDDLANSNIEVFEVKARYLRLEITNRNTNDLVSVDTDIGEHMEQIA